MPIVDQCLHKQCGVRAEDSFKDQTKVNPNNLFGQQTTRTASKPSNRQTFMKRFVAVVFVDMQAPQEAKNGQHELNLTAHCTHVLQKWFHIWLFFLKILTVFRFGLT